MLTRGAPSADRAPALLKCGGILVGHYFSEKSIGGDCGLVASSPVWPWCYRNTAATCATMPNARYRSKAT